MGWREPAAHRESGRYRYGDHRAPVRWQDAPPCPPAGHGYPRGARQVRPRCVGPVDERSCCTSRCPRGNRRYLGLAMIGPGKGRGNPRSGRAAAHIRRFVGDVGILRHHLSVRRRAGLQWPRPPLAKPLPAGRNRPTPDSSLHALRPLLALHCSSSARVESRIGNSALSGQSSRAPFRSCPHSTPSNWRSMHRSKPCICISGHEYRNPAFGRLPKRIAGLEPALGFQDVGLTQLISLA